MESVKYSVGDWVDKDTVVVTFPKDNPSANYYQAKTVYENLEATYKRMSNLYNSKGISKQDYDNAKTAYRRPTMSKQGMYSLQSPMTASSRARYGSRSGI